MNFNSTASKVIFHFVEGWLLAIVPATVVYIQSNGTGFLAALSLGSFAGLLNILSNILQKSYSNGK